MRVASVMSRKGQSGPQRVGRWASAWGFTLFDLMTALAVASVASGIALPACKSSISNYRLNSAVQTLSRDLEQIRLQALGANSTLTFRRESERSYSVVGRTRDLPDGVRFYPTSADSIAFDRLGALSGGASVNLVLASGSDRRVELRVGASGAVEVRR